MLSRLNLLRLQPSQSALSYTFRPNSLFGRIVCGLAVRCGFCPTPGYRTYALVRWCDSCAIPSLLVPSSHYLLILCDASTPSLSKFASRTFGLDGSRMLVSGSSAFSSLGIGARSRLRRFPSSPFTPLFIVSLSFAPHCLWIVRRLLACHIFWPLSHLAE